LVRGLSKGKAEEDGGAVRERKEKGEGRKGEGPPAPNISAENSPWLKLQYF